MKARRDEGNRGDGLLTPAVGSHLWTPTPRATAQSPCKTPGCHSWANLSGYCRTCRKKRLDVAESASGGCAAGSA